MGGGLLQLVAYGAQDVYLTGNPQITFWKLVYRRHSNFSMESIEQSFNGSAGFDKRITAQISRNGDLIHKMWLSMTIADGGATKADVGRIGLAAVKSVELEIGGQKIDKIYGFSMDIWNELTLPKGLEDAYEELTNPDAVSGKYYVHVPLEFYFCRNPGLALPLIALQYHDVKINIEFDKAAACFKTNASSATLTEARLWVDYVFLDTDERRRFSQLSHEYLVEQLQYTGDEALSGTNATVRLNFNHPVKELIWVLRQTGDVHKLTYEKELESAKLQLNGHDRFAERDGKYFQLIQPFQHHSRVNVDKGIYVYSFALRPEEHQPSGTLNMSRIDTASLKLTLTSGAAADAVSVLATNYNVLRIMSGMGGLSYAN